MDPDLDQNGVRRCARGVRGATVMDSEKCGVRGAIVMVASQLKSLQNTMWKLLLVCAAAARRCSVTMGQTHPTTSSLQALAVAQQNDAAHLTNQAKYQNRFQNTF